MQNRREPPDAIEDFPTPPWATRALLSEVLLPRTLVSRFHQAWEPAFTWIPPGRREALTMPDDEARFAPRAQAPIPLFDGSAA